MVAGGYNRDLPNGLTRDVELISTIPRNQCSKRVRPLKATVIYEFNNRRETDADILGMTGQVNESIILVRNIFATLRMIDR